MSLSVEDILGPEGLIAANLDRYEPRQEQMEMARAVESAFVDCEHLLVEAGTGVGKSFAYLVPAILQAFEHHRRVVISTYSIALQEQLIYNDLPFLAEVLGKTDVTFSAMLGKGRQHYLCLQRLASVIKNRDKLFYAERHQEQLEALAEWAMETETGQRQDIEFELDQTVWSKVCAEPTICTTTSQKHQKCFFPVARQKLLAADILVVNHALFFSDLAMQSEGASLLGAYDMVVVDEAHMVESMASEHFGCNAANFVLNAKLRELYNEQNDRGLLALGGDNEAIRAVQRATTAVDGFFADLAHLDSSQKSRSGRILQPEVVPDSITGPLTTVAEHLKQVRRDIPDEEQRREIVNYEMFFQESVLDLKALISQSREKHAYWVTVRQPERRESPGLFRKQKLPPLVWLSCAPINVAPIMKNLLFDVAESAVLTSATLATSRGDQHGFDYIRQRLGLNDGREVLLSSPFDFRRQAKLYIETRLGDPNDLETFGPAATGAIRHYVNKSQGRCFVLATSYRQLTALAEELEDFCIENNYELLVQGQSKSKRHMLETFRSRDRSILLGTMSFWQGVDVAGEALQNVIITKLPFAAPDEPLIEARLDAIRDSGGSPFMQYQLPQAIILFKQGFGRLIRSTQDTGFVVVLDHRLATKRYGGMFIQALPDIEVIRDEFSMQEWM